MPSSILNSDDGVISGTSGIKTTGGDDGSLKIQTNGTDAISISSGQRSTFPTTIGVGGATPSTSGAGITFPATSSASSDANTLDDYEEGTFTPTLQGGTTAGTTTYLVQEGTYTKVGRQVTVSLYINASAATGTGGIFIGGLPFSSVSGFYGAATVMVREYNWGSGTYLVAYMAGGLSYFEIFSCADDASWATQSMVNEAQRFIITATYFV
jgi:hypothetical protein